ncbi:MAG: PadR family transcriptional regulator [Candidatus Dormibacteria bacterium]
MEPALLLLLQKGPSHGYQLAEELAEIVGETRVDLGNLYRLLRSLESEGLVQSSWRPDLPGPLKRTYEISDEGASLLAAWVESLRLTQALVATFINRFDESRRTT